MAGPFDFLHIKGRTAGSSNELSFDVLDAARHDLDEKRRANRSRIPGAPRPSQGSYHGVGGTSTLSAVPEVERRKRVRRARAIRIRVLVVVAVIALVSVGAFAGYRFYEDKVDFTGRFSTLIDQFVEIDRSIVQVDALMSDPLNSASRDDRDKALSSFSALDERLEHVVLAAREMTEGARSDADIAALSAVEVAAEARRSMLEAATDAFKLSDIANRQMADVNEAWSKVLAGDAAAREATALANSAKTEEATLKSREKTEEAIELMTAGRTQLAIAEQSLAGLNFSAEKAYIGKRIESLEAAVRTSDALLANDRAAAIAANDAYNAADRAATTLAASLPPAVDGQVRARYVDEVERKSADYASARASASSADSNIRSYLPRF